MKILITGASSGIGFEAAQTLANKGHEVWAVARSVDKLQELARFGVHTKAMDVTSAEQRHDVIETIGTVDVLINNAGFGFYGPMEQVPLEDAKYQFEVNVFGLAEMTKLVIPGMRAQRKGRIINVSSMGGRMTIPFGGWYHASKYAVESLSDAMRMELKPFGIDVVVIEPGGIKTNWGIITADNLEQSSANGPYQEKAARLAKTLRRSYSGKLLSKPQVVVNALVKAVELEKPRTRYTVGRGAKLFVGLKAVLPDRAFDKLVAMS
ncbi:oxidoreductase [Corynebacterium sp. H130]|uniref:oxidoreductase n=1 Tax=Corynebacterium sp. H130 TaxID=3133444 RepID=UPI0030ABDC3A